MIPDGEISIGTMGMILVVALFTMIAWVVRAIVLKGMDLQQARQDRARLKAYEEPAAASAHAESEIASDLSRLQGIEQRLTEIERILREVDEPVLAR